MHRATATGFTSGSNRRPPNRETIPRDDLAAIRRPMTPAEPVGFVPTPLAVPVPQAASTQPEPGGF